MPDQRDLATLYLAQAEYLTSRVAAGQATNAEAMLALAYFRTNILAAEGQKRQQVAIDRWVKAMEASASQGGGGSRRGSGSGGESPSSQRDNPVHAVAAGR